MPSSGPAAGAYTHWSRLLEAWHGAVDLGAGGTDCVLLALAPLHESMAYVLHRQGARGRRRGLPLDAVRGLAAQALTALDALHRCAASAARGWWVFCAPHHCRRGGSASQTQQLNEAQAVPNLCPSRRRQGAARRREGALARLCDVSVLLSGSGGGTVLRRSAAPCGACPEPFAGSIYVIFVIWVRRPECAIRTSRCASRGCSVDRQ